MFSRNVQATPDNGPFPTSLPLGTHIESGMSCYVSYDMELCRNIFALSVQTCSSCWRSSGWLWNTCIVNGIIRLQNSLLCKQNMKVKEWSPIVSLGLTFLSAYTLKVLMGFNLCDPSGLKPGPGLCSFTAFRPIEARAEAAGDWPLIRLLWLFRPNHSHSWYNSVRPEWRVQYRSTAVGLIISRTSLEEWL